MSRILNLFLFSILFLTVFGAPAPDEVVEEDESDKRIIGGGECKISSHKEICSFRIYMEKTDTGYTYTQCCGATILSHRWACTAAHCVDAAVNAKTEAKTKCYEDRVKDPDPDVSRCTCDVFITCGITACNERGQNIDVEKAIVHPGWTGKGVGPHDMALLYLKQRVQFNLFVQPATLPSPLLYHDPQVMKQATIVGWGATHPVLVQESQSPTLKEAIVPVHPTSVCFNQYGPGKIIPGNHICIGTDKDTSCGGDSGGPLFDRSHQLWGVTSFGTKKCGEGPSVYCSIPAYIHWIQTKIAMHDPENPELQFGTGAP